MIIGITGTPGTGKTAVTKLLEKYPLYQVIHLNELIQEEKLYSEVDTERDCVVADMELIYSRVMELQDFFYPVMIIDSHLSHHISDIVIVLRTSPAILKTRLEKRKYSVNKVQENLEAEALDIILAEAVDWCGTIFELDTTGRTVESTLQDIDRIIKGLQNSDTKDLEKEYRPGTVDWSDYIFD